MNLLSMRRMVAAMVMSGMLLGGSMAHGQTPKKPVAPQPKPCPCPAPRPVATVNTGGALGQLERAAGVGAGSSHTGVTFDGRATSGQRSASDVFVKPTVDVRCCQPAIKPTPATPVKKR